MIKYKIRDSITGLYSTGGHTPKFTKSGKLWSHLGHVKSHLSYFRAIPDSWVVVEIQLTECGGYPAKTIHKATSGGRAMLGHGYWQIPSELVKGSPEWSKYVSAKMAGKDLT